MDGQRAADVEMQAVAGPSKSKVEKNRGEFGAAVGRARKEDKYWHTKVAKLKRFEETFIGAKDWETDTEPFRGFDLEKEKPLLDQVEEESAILYELIKEMENEEAIELCAAFTAVNNGGPVPFPAALFDGPAEYASAITIQIIRAPHQDQTMQEIVAELRKPLDAGWKRELIYKGVSDTKADVVQYLSPDGTELKTMEDIVDYLENIYGISSGGVRASNFSFHKSPVTNLGYDCGEYIYVVDSAGKKRLVNIRRRSPSTKKTEAELPSPQNGEEPLIQPSRGVPLQQREGPFRQPGLVRQNRGVSITAANVQQMKAGATNRMENATPGLARRRVQGSTLGAPGMNRRTDDGMFTISAMHRTGLDGRRGPLRRDRQMFEEQHQFGNNMEEEVLPCSIRCPRMTGKVPNLQCKSCLCLYHGACLGFPPKAKFANFICPNCDAKQNSEHATAPKKPNMGQNVPGHMLRQTTMTKPLNQPMGNPMITRRIGQTVISPEFQPIGKGGMSIRRFEIKPPELPGTRSRMVGLPLQSVSGPPKKGLWAAGKIPIPSLSSGGKSMMTPMAKIPRGRAPPLPNLHPMLPNNANSLAPPPIGRPSFILRGLIKAAGSRPVVPLPDLKRQRVASSQIPISNNIQRTAEEKRNMTKQWAAATGQFRQYPQAIITIGNKKFIAMPHGQTDKNRNQVDSTSETDVKLTNNGHEEEKPMNSEAETFVLKKIFPYLSIRDLLSASRVSQSWNKAASNEELWQTVRMKNAHIFDYEGFVNALNQHQTQVLDLRKMACMSEVSWNGLAECLTKLPSLKQIVLGPRSSPPSLIETITTRCPNIQLVA